MKNPYEFGHYQEPSGCDCCDDLSECGEDGEQWPCEAMQKYTAWLDAKEAKKLIQPKYAIPRLEALIAELQKTIYENAEAHNKIVGRLAKLEDFVYDALAPLARDLLTHKSTGELSVPAAGWFPGQRDALIGVGRGFRSGASLGLSPSASYVYKAVDGRVYTNGKITTGADLSKVKN